MDADQIQAELVCKQMKILPRTCEAFTSFILSTVSQEVVKKDKTVDAHLILLA